MSDRFSYLILGAGKQGLAAAYDLLKHGRAARLTVADGSPRAARAAVRRLRAARGAGRRTHVGGWRGSPGHRA